MSKYDLLTGNAAIARGFWEAGGTVASSYPGSPTVEIMESLQSLEGISATWSTSEKVALEKAIGASMAGARSMVSMKHVGLNIAADPFMTFTQTRTKGGFVLVVGDDPGLSSSQNEQDSRYYARFANIPVLEPSTPREAKEMMMQALDMSENHGTPVMVRLTSTLCHSRGVVPLAERNEHTPSGFEKDQARFNMLPPHANRQQFFMRERMERLAEASENSELNELSQSEDSGTLIVVSGLAHEYLMELTPRATVMKLGFSYPAPLKRIREVASGYDKVLVVEEMMPLLENEIRVAGMEAEGKRFFPFTGELNSDVLRKGLLAAGVEVAAAPGSPVEKSAVPRTPMLCAGCPHRPIFDILREAEVTVVGDIGCYSLGILPPFEVLNTVISMGASLGMVQGMAAAHRAAGIEKPLVVTIGDGTLFHSGLTGFADLASTSENITVIVLDNRTTAMTGGQITPTTAEYQKDDSGFSINIAGMLQSLGVADVAEVDQFYMARTRRLIGEALERPGLSVIVATRPCALNFKVVNPYFVVDPAICISCKRCIQVNCPPIAMVSYEGHQEQKSSINPAMCVGCSVCSQVCPVKAIKSSALKKVQEGKK